MYIWPPTLPDEIQEAMKEVMDAACALDGTLADFDYRTGCILTIQGALENVIQNMMNEED